MPVKQWELRKIALLSTLISQSSRPNHIPFCSSPCYVSTSLLTFPKAEAIYIYVHIYI